ncbi:IDEAL domain-containing protein [Listeria fleischmannii]|uniref:IDEAL domain-containing protein n=1 Tax=Listeria fleischmannii FSL S10-1203 TaxID=1265822 RepID=W7E021_9LIST|nr:IDEAL domain-containing protein [Listeria fleischmannii]EUJ59497.1 hypothetical protein MCOL2_05845 [Listeria fleischmannii FSL S10-1203]
MDDYNYNVLDSSLKGVSGHHKRVLSVYKKIVRTYLNLLECCIEYNARQYQIRELQKKVDTALDNKDEAAFIKLTKQLNSLIE